MSKFKVVWLFFFLIISFPSHSQQLAEVKGSITNTSNQPIHGATIVLNGTNKGAKADKNGFFKITGISFGNHQVTISAVGYQTINRSLACIKNIIDLSEIQMTPDQKIMAEVEVIGRSTTSEVTRQPYNVSAIDAKKLYNTTLDIGQALNRVSGVRLRESGGVGSNMSFSINGFSGNQVKLFLDGIPMDNFGSSFQLNNIPINFAERVEVYKGVVPVWLGGDALGGAVNIVTKNEPGKYLDASYSYGSFNTHKTAINAGYIADNGLTMTLSAFQNYSDNNYWVNVRTVDFDTGKYTNGRRRRFHDTYRNETMVYNIGVSNKKYADQLLFGITLGENKKEIQTGNHMDDVYGGREALGNIIQPSVKYIKKDLFVKGLDVNIFGRYNLGRERSLDTVNRRFTWSGESEPKDKNNPNAPGGENELRDYRFNNNNGNFIANLSYAINEKHHFMVNHLLTTFDRKGKDKYYPDLEINKLPRKTTKNITALGYRTNIADQWDLNVFVKNYNQKGKYFEEVKKNEIYKNVETTVNKLGYGFAASYFVNPTLQLKASYEKASRLPENNELFGDAQDLSANPTLKPENSHNINVGLSYTKKWNENNHIIIDANYTYRNATDFIRLYISPLSSNNKRESKYLNLRSVLNNGVDLNLKYFYKNQFSIGGNLTYQNIINNTKYEPGQLVESSVYKDRMPNIPYLYGNADAAYYLHHFGGKHNTLTIGYNLQYIHAFFLDFPSLGTPAQRFIIPKQLSHDVNIVYAMASGKYNVALECNNLTDATRYDNFELQKPSRSFNVKFRYFIRKK